MTNFLRGALVGAIALGGLAITATESSAMPVGNVVPLASEAGQQAGIDKVWWRGGYGYGWRRPFYGYGWRRPFYGYGYGWRRPWRYGYHAYRRPYGFYRW